MIVATYNCLTHRYDAQDDAGTVHGSGWTHADALRAAGFDVVMSGRVDIPDEPQPPTPGGPQPGPGPGGATPAPIPATPAAVTSRVPARQDSGSPCDVRNCDRPGTPHAFAGRADRAAVLCDAHRRGVGNV